MDRAGLTNEGLADKLGITRQTVHYWFKKNRLPDGPTMLRLPKELGVPVAWLYGEDPNAESARIGALEVVGKIEDFAADLRRQYAGEEGGEGDAGGPSPRVPNGDRPVQSPGGRMDLYDLRKRDEVLEEKPETRRRASGGGEESG